MNAILKFEPIFKSVIWGGQRIARFKGIAPQGDHIGESWELSPMEGNESVVAEGPFKGIGLNRLIADRGDEIMGARLMKACGGRFPLLIKFIDSTDDLSVQVHPDDDLAARRHNGSLGKTEMWYSILPAEGAYLYAGFSRRLDADSFRSAVADNSIIDSLRRHDTRPGDVFFLPAGRIHAIGAGNLLVEVQETSDVTYRIYDYGRIDATTGKPRQLHVEEAKDAIDYKVYPSYTSTPTDLGNGIEELVQCDHFTVYALTIDGEHVFRPVVDSFSTLTCIEGEMTVTDSNGCSVSLRRGESALMPACHKEFVISGKGRVIDAHS